jgi:hypothetical protein
MLVKRIPDPSGPLAVDDFQAIGAAEERAVNPVNHPRQRVIDAEAVQVDAARRCRRATFALRRIPMSRTGAFGPRAARQV